jgi:hypothetical protein
MVTPLGKLTIEQLLHRVAEYDAMAATATSLQTVAALHRLAERFRALARQRAATVDHLPGVAVRVGGTYQLLNIFGTPDGQAVTLREGEPHPKPPAASSGVFAPTSTRLRQVSVLPAKARMQAIMRRDE